MKTQEEVLQSWIDEYEDCFNRQPKEDTLIQWKMEIVQLFEDGIYD